MTQLANQVPVAGTVSGVSMAQKINDALMTGQTNFQGATDPATIGSITVSAGMTWNDTTNDLRKIRSADNTTWIPFAVLSTGDYFGYQVHNATAKTVVADADELGLIDSTASWIKKKITFANFKAQTIDGFARENFIINGDMRVAQRATSSTTQGYSTVDRFYCSRDGGVGGLTMTTSTGAFLDPRSFLSLQRTSGDVNAALLNIYQPLEAQDCKRLAGKQIAVSCAVGTGANVALSGHLLKIYYRTDATEGGPSSAGWTGLPSVPFSVAAGSAYAKKSGTFTIPANATQLMLNIVFAVTAVAGVDERFYVTDVLLVDGSAPTDFKARPYQQELALCRRFMRRDAVYVLGYSTASGRKLASVNVSDMRAVPAAVRTYDVAGNLNKISTLDGLGTGTNNVVPTAVLAQATQGAIWSYAYIDASTAAGILAIIESECELL